MCTLRRQTFYEMAAVIGRPVWKFSSPQDAARQKNRTYWRSGDWMPLSPGITSGASDTAGLCNGNENLKPPFACVRDLWFGGMGHGERASRLSYVYLMSDEAWQREKIAALMQVELRPKPSQRVLTSAASHECRPADLCCLACSAALKPPRSSP